MIKSTVTPEFLRIFKRFDVLLLWGWLIFLLILVFGAYASLKVGISWDEEIEFKTFQLNLDALIGAALGNFENYHALTAYQDRYYGVGFHWISHSIGGLLNFISGPVLEFSELGSRLIWAHFINFLAFMLSGLVFRQCVFILTSDRVISSLGALVFLLWPYLFGHALMNVKDVPFMLAWLCCTYQSLRVVIAIPKTYRSLLINCLFLGAMTGWLFSIRVSGVLIAIQYTGLLLILLKDMAASAGGRLQFRDGLRIGMVFLAALSLALFCLYPILWHNPFEFFNAIAYMSHHPWQGNTLTAGQFIEPQSRLFFFIASWLLVKLPVVVLVGLCAIPLVVYRLAMHRKFSIRIEAWMSLVLTTGVILGALVMGRVALYHDLRQILFIAPLLLLISVVSIFIFSRKAALAGLVLTSIMMIMDDLSLHPYEYSYINEIARFTSVGKKYETDYFGLSVAQSARWLNSSAVDGLHQCLYVPSPHLWRYEINPHKFPCVQGYPGDLSLIKEPFIFFAQLRGNMDFAVPPWCRQIHLEQRSMSFSGASLKMGALYQCSM